MIQRFTRLPAIQSHVGLSKNVGIIIAFAITTAIGLWIDYRGRKPEELVPEESRFDVKADGTQITNSRSNISVKSRGWSDLVKVEILTSEDGPILPVVFRALYDPENSGAVIPQVAPKLALNTEKT